MSHTAESAPSGDVTLPGHVNRIQRDAKPIGMPWSRDLAPLNKQVPPGGRRYHWIDEEAEKLIAEAYKLHMPNRPFPPSVKFDRARLEELDLPHVPPKTFFDRIVLMIVTLLENLVHLFFWNKYDRHAMTLETIAGVPGMVAGMHRHMRSLRRMTRDHGWIDKMLEESSNERMHLLIWLEHVKPNWIERMLVLCAQAVYTTAYYILYLISPEVAHRMVGYMEEAAFRSYTEFLDAVDSGTIQNIVLPPDHIAKKYYRMPDGSTLRDVILHIRADEAFHGLYNHGLSDQIHEGGIDRELLEPGETDDVLETENAGEAAVLNSLLVPVQDQSRRSSLSSHNEFIMLDDDSQRGFGSETDEDDI